jgi:dihydroorotase
MNKSGKKEFILRGGRVIDPVNNIDQTADVGISSDGKIAEPDCLADPEIIDLAGLVVCPGFVDLHVHLRQPGRSDKEDIATGTRAAAAGGFAQIVTMPNTSPVADNSGTIEYIRRHAANEGVVKVLPAAAMTKGIAGENMTGIGSLKKYGVVAISDDGRCVQNHDVMRHIVEYAKTFELPILDHCEDETLAGDGVMHEGQWSTLLGLKGIPAASEELMVARDIILAEISDWKVHIQHISSKGSVRLVRDAQKRGVKVSAEVTPHHIALNDERLKSFDTNYKMKPPIMSEDHRQALIEGLQDGTISCIATDHAPHTETEKMVEFDYAPFGIIGLETAVPVCMTELYHKNFLSLYDLISKFTKGPAELLGLEGVSLAPGTPADITVLDPEKYFVIDKNNFYSKSRNTPFHGYKARGKSVALFVDGNCIYSELNRLEGII